MSKSITFDWSENAECIIDPGDHEIRLSFDQIQMFWFLAQHGKNLVTAYRNSPQYHNHCQCCGAEMLNKMDANLEDLMFNMSMFFDLYTNWSYLNSSALSGMLHSVNVRQSTPSGGVINHAASANDIERSPTAL